MQYLNVECEYATCNAHGCVGHMFFFLFFFFVKELKISKDA
jgi:hypothetical protein